MVSTNNYNNWKIGKTRFQFGALAQLSAGALDVRFDRGTLSPKKQFIHQPVQVPKMEILNLIRLFWGIGFPLHKPYIQLI